MTAAAPAWEKSSSEVPSAIFCHQQWRGHLLCNVQGKSSFVLSPYGNCLSERETFLRWNEREHSRGVVFFQWSWGHAWFPGKHLVSLPCHVGHCTAAQAKLSSVALSLWSHWLIHAGIHTGQSVISLETKQIFIEYLVNSLMSNRRIIQITSWINLHQRRSL